MSTTVLTAPVRSWRCPSCDQTVKVQRYGVYTQFHECKAFGGANIPLVEVKDVDDKPNGRHVLCERDDYMGSNDPALSRYASISTEHGDGSNDRTVFAPVARSQAMSRMFDDEAELKFKDAEIARLAGIASGLGATMSWTGSHVFAYAQYDMALKNLNLTTDGYKVAVFTTNATPDNTVSTLAATEYGGGVWTSGNEVAVSGSYSAGGASVGGVSWVQTSNVVEFNSSLTPSWTSVTWSSPNGAYGCLVYDTTSHSGANNGLCYNYFGGQQAVTAGTFSISWNTSGIATWTT